MRRTRAHLRGKDVGGRICAGSERHREQLVRHLPRLGTPLEALEPRVRLPDLRRRLRTESRAELVDHPESGVVHCLHVILETRRKKKYLGAARCVSLRSLPLACAFLPAPSWQLRVEGQAISYDDFLPWYLPPPQR